MKKSNWLSIIVVLISFVALAEVVFLVRIYSRLDATEKKISRMGDLLAELDYLSEGSRKSPREERDGRRLSSLEQQLQALRLGLSSLRAQNTLEPELEDNLDLLVERKLGEKMIEAMSTFRGPLAEKQKFEIVSQQIDLTENQRQEVQDSLSRVQEGIVDIAQTAGENDPAFVKGLNKIMKGRMPPKQRLRRIRKHLATHTRPNTQETYLDTVLQLRRQAFDELRSTLTPQQLAELKSMNVIPKSSRPTE